MPEMTGLELLETLRSQDVRIPALMMTGRHDPSLEPRIAQAGVVKLLHKPIQDEQLFSWINKPAATPRRRRQGKQILSRAQANSLLAG